MKTMYEIQTALDRISVALDESELDPTSDEFKAMVADFLEVAGTREDKVDAYIAVLDRNESLVKEKKRQFDRIEKSYRSSQRIQKEFKAQIQMFMENDKSGLPFKGKNLGEIYLKRNGKASLDLDCEEKKVALAHVIDDIEAIEKMGDYVERRTVYVVKTPMVRADIEQGKDLGWARLIKGKHIATKG